MDPTKIRESRIIACLAQGSRLWRVTPGRAARTELFPWSKARILNRWAREFHEVGDRHQIISFSVYFDDFAASDPTARPPHSH